MARQSNDDSWPSRYWHFVGDSHAEVFRHASENGWIDLPCKFTIVNGATAVGLRNPNVSKTNAMEIFRSDLLPCDPLAIPVVQLGEVDCGFVIWYRAQKYRESVEMQKAHSIKSYFEFVDDLMASGYRDIVITAATVPTIKDGANWGDVANLRREIAVSLADRTRLTLEYNEGLSHEAAMRNLPYIDLTRVVLSKNTGTILERFRHPDPTDHHLNPDAIGPLLASALNSVWHKMNDESRAQAHENKSRWLRWLRRPFG